MDPSKASSDAIDRLRQALPPRIMRTQRASSLRMHLLLIEDNPADMRLVQEALAESKLPVAMHWMPSGEQALSFLRQDGGDGSGPRPDLVLLDLNLPGLCGQEVLATIKQDPALLSIPVVVLTSSSARADVQAAYRAHANAYMVKPDDFQAFLVLMGKIHSYWLRTALLLDWGGGGGGG